MFLPARQGPIFFFISSYLFFTTPLGAELFTYFFNLSILPNRVTGTRRENSGNLLYKGSYRYLPDL
jgi:hypothetical protein